MATFIENCDTFDSSKWNFEWNAPTAANGEWVFNIPAGVSKNIVARSKAVTFGYGHYKITFRTSGLRVPGVNYCPFLFADNTGNGGEYNELDIPELYGARPTNDMSISSFKGTLANNAYDYFLSSMLFEDGAFEELILRDFTYGEPRLELYCSNLAILQNSPDGTAQMIVVRVYYYD